MVLVDLGKCGLYLSADAVDAAVGVVVTAAATAAIEQELHGGASTSRARK